MYHKYHMVSMVPIFFRILLDSTIEFKIILVTQIIQLQGSVSFIISGEPKESEWVLIAVIYNLFE